MWRGYLFNKQVLILDVPLLFFQVPENENCTMAPMHTSFITRQFSYRDLLMEID